ncbi:hypothetical protein DRJ17_01355 [Candidatus Woesearchaeota archaeon]|nr:MAG: hypothetical protein DRJ17_01355 [Candidatus Woesearchaeota archaeon]
MVNPNLLEVEIGRTPLIRYKGRVPNKNKIWIKRECDNPFGSHYDRVYLKLFKHCEEQGKIYPGDKVIETTSGAAGVSFAGIGRLLGYDCYVALPAGGEKAREEAIKSQLPNDDHLILTPAEEYISGFPKFLKKFLAEHKDYFFLNHSMGPRNKQIGRYENNEITLKALEEIAKEVVEEIEVDYFIPAVGNGSSVLGPGREFKRVSPKIKIIAFETFQSAVAYEQMYPNEYERIFGIKPGTLSRHRLPGTSYQGIDFPHIRNAVEGGIIDDVVLVSDTRMDEEYERITERNCTKKLPHWDMPLVDHEDLGRTGKAGIAVALKIAEKVNGKNLVVIGYDKAERYDS